MPIKAVIFDIGGVLVSSPLTRLKAHCIGLGLPGDFFHTIVKSGVLFIALERGDIDSDAFVALFATEMAQLT